MNPSHFTKDNLFKQKFMKSNRQEPRLNGTERRPRPGSGAPTIISMLSAPKLLLSAIIILGISSSVVRADEQSTPGDRLSAKSHTEALINSSSSTISLSEPNQKRQSSFMIYTNDQQKNQKQSSKLHDRDESQVESKPSASLTSDLESTSLVRNSIIHDFWSSIWSPFSGDQKNRPDEKVKLLIRRKRRNESK